MSYLRYQQYHCDLRFGILRFDTLPYRLDQVFSIVVPTIPTIPRYFEISITYHTSSIRYFQQPYPRYPRVPRYGIPRVYTRGMPGMVPYPRFLCIFNRLMFWLSLREPNIVYISVSVMQDLHIFVRPPRRGDLFGLPRAN